MGEALISLLDSRQNAQTEIERGHALRIEARTLIAAPSPDVGLNDQRGSWAR